jgi:hypothetical protein
MTVVAWSSVIGLGNLAVVKYLSRARVSPARICAWPRPHQRLVLVPAGQCKAPYTLCPAQARGVVHTSITNLVRATDAHAFLKCPQVLLDN